MIVLLTLYPIAMLELLFLNPLTQVPRGGQLTDAALPTAPAVLSNEPPCSLRDIDDRRRAGNHDARTGPPAS